MPFKSKAQQRYMFAAEDRGEVPSGTAKRWAKHTKNMKTLPEHVADKNQYKAAFIRGFAKAAEDIFDSPAYRYDTMNMLMAKIENDYKLSPLQKNQLKQNILAYRQDHPFIANRDNQGGVTSMLGSGAAYGVGGLLSYLLMKGVDLPWHIKLLLGGAGAALGGTAIKALWGDDDEAKKTPGGFTAIDQQPREISQWTMI